MLIHLKGTDRESFYSQTINTTCHVLVRRATQYKWLAIGVSLGGLICLISIWQTHDQRILLLLLWLPAFVLIYCSLDFRMIHRWRFDIILLWARDELALSLFAQTLRQVPALPPQTLEGMLGSLPEWPSDSSIPMAVREPLCRLQTQVASIAVRRMWVRAALWLLSWSSVSAAWVWHMAPLLGGLLAVPLINGGWRLTERLLLRRQVMALVQVMDEAGVTRTNLVTWVEAVCWDGVLASLKLSCLADLASRPIKSMSPARPTTDQNR